MASLQIPELQYAASIEYDARVHSRLNTSEFSALEEFMKYLEGFSKWNGIPVEAIRVSVPAEEDASQIVSAIYVLTEAEKAMAFWKALENDTDDWLDKQDAQAKGFIIDHVVIVVRW